MCMGDRAQLKEQYHKSRGDRYLHLCVIFLRTLHDLTRECHEIIVSTFLYKILVHLSPNEMLYKALVGDCS